MLRLIQSLRSRFYVRHERQLAKTLAARIAEKCQLIGKLSAAKKEHAVAEMSLGNARLGKGPLNRPSLADACGKVVKANSMLEELTSVVQELNEERAQHHGWCCGDGDSKAAGRGPENRHTPRSFSQPAWRPGAKPCWCLPPEHCCSLPSTRTPSCPAALATPHPPDHH